jgi:hypothetical protein
MWNILTLAHLPKSEGPMRDMTILKTVNDRQHHYLELPAEGLASCNFSCFGVKVWAVLVAPSWWGKSRQYCSQQTGSQKHKKYHMARSWCSNSDYNSGHLALSPNLLLHSMTQPCSLLSPLVSKPWGSMGISRLQRPHFSKFLTLNGLSGWRGWLLGR